MDTLTVRPARATEEEVANLIGAHVALMQASSPEESCHVQPADALEGDGAILFAAEDTDGEVLGIGAVKIFAPGHGEIKSMHTTQAARGRGVARAILHELMKAAQDQGLARLSLETGSDEMFAPARSLYQTEGFETCPPFGEYSEDPLSVFFTRVL